VKHFLGTVKGDEPLGARERYGPLDHPTAEEIAASAHAELAGRPGGEASARVQREAPQAGVRAAGRRFDY
jgi:hypothetical protein